MLGRCLWRLQLGHGCLERKSTPWLEPEHPTGDDYLKTIFARPEFRVPRTAYWDGLADLVGRYLGCVIRQPERLAEGSVNAIAALLANLWHFDEWLDAKGPSVTPVAVNAVRELMTAAIHDRDAAVAGAEIILESVHPGYGRQLYRMMVAHREAMVSLGLGVAAAPDYWCSLEKHVRAQAEFALNPEKRRRYETRFFEQRGTRGGMSCTLELLLLISTRTTPTIDRHIIEDVATSTALLNDIYCVQDDSDACEPNAVAIEGPTRVVQRINALNESIVERCRGLLLKNKGNRETQLAVGALMDVLVGMDRWHRFETRYSRGRSDVDRLFANETTTSPGLER